MSNGNIVTITGPGTIIGEQSVNGETVYEWSFPVIVNGQGGTYIDWVNTDNESLAEQDALEFLQSGTDMENFTPSGVQGSDSGPDEDDDENDDENDDDGNLVADNQGGDDHGDSG